MSLKGRYQPRGQAAVETALTMPLTLFVVLGSIQLFMLMQAKVMAQYAVFQAARMGSVSNGRCDIMLHAAILSFTPVVRAFLSPTVGGTPGEQLATVFGEFANNDYGTFHGWAGDNIVWIVRERPRFPGDDIDKARKYFDNPLVNRTDEPVRLELRAIFWTPLLVPFVDWVFSRMALAHLGLEPYTKVNPLEPTQKNANWQREGWATFSLQGPIATELVRRLGAKHYVYPIEVTYTMRMMSPVMLSDFAQPNCPGTPGSL
jgi:hypothetical protein